MATLSISAPCILKPVGCAAGTSLLPRGGIRIAKHSFAFSSITLETEEEMWSAALRPIDERLLRGEISLHFSYL